MPLNTLPVFISIFHKYDFLHRYDLSVFYRPILISLCRNQRAMWLYSQNTKWLLWRAQWGRLKWYRASRRSREQFSFDECHLHHNHFGSLIWKRKQNNKPFSPKITGSSICWVVLELHSMHLFHFKMFKNSYGYLSSCRIVYQVFFQNL